MKRLLLIGGGVIVLLLAILFGAFFAGPLLASANNSSQVASTPTATPTNKYCDQYLQDLANRLHVSVDTLRQAQLGAKDDVLTQMVKDGKLTQSEANAIRQRLQSHQVCSGKNWGPGRVSVAHILLQKYRDDLVSQVAQGLHLSADQLKSQLQSGKSLADIASAQHVSSSQLHTIVLNAVQNDLNKAVKAGDLTQQQASDFQQYLQKHPGVLDRLVKAHLGKHKKA